MFMYMVLFEIIFKLLKFILNKYWRFYCQY